MFFSTKSYLFLTQVGCLYCKIHHFVILKTTMRYAAFCLLLTALTACRSNKEAQPATQSMMLDSLSTAIEMPAQVPPNHCRIVGKILQIDSTLLPDKTSPCGKAPCRAVVKITQVLGYGSSFGNPLADGQEISAMFAFTLAPTTKDLFPNIDKRLPGLSVGSVFTADVQSLEQFGGGTAYQIFNYWKK
jgi:hypothetical protein